jgi:hypothetical protein
MAEITRHRCRLLRSRPGWFIVAILVCEAFLLFSQRFKWFPFNAHKGWGVLIAMACMGMFFVVFFLWFTAALLFRWQFQFSVRSLLSLFVVAAVPLGWLAAEMKAAERHADAVRWIRTAHRDGGCHYDWECDAQGRSMSSTKTPPATRGLRNLLGDDFFADVVYVGFADVDPPIPARDLEHLKCLTRVKRAEFNDSGVTDAGLEHLKGMKELECLTLIHNHITDAGLRSLEGLAELRVLNLDENRMAGPGLEHLRGLTKLRELYLERMPITGAGLKFLNGLTQLEVLKFNETHITDADLEQINGLTNLRRLSLTKTRITSNGLKHLNRMTQLQVLCLNHTDVGDDGINHLKALSQLRQLGLSHSRVTDAGVKHLKCLKQLRYVDLRGTAVTWSGGSELSKAIGPELDVWTRP